MNRKTTPRTSRISPNLSIRGLIDGEDRWVAVTHDGTTRLVAYSRFIDRAGATRALSELGIVLVRSEERKKLFELVEDLRTFTPAVIFTKPGWHRGLFATASGRVIRPQRASKGIIAFTPAKTKCARGGSSAQWKRDVAERLVGHPIPSFFVMSAFAAPLLDVVRRTDNFGFELSGEGGKGKSTTQRLLASTVGAAMEKDGSYLETFYATASAMEQKMCLHSDMPFIIDEANLYGAGEGEREMARKMRQFAFQMAAGTTKGRFGDPVQVGYRFIYVTSSNEPFHETLTCTHRDKAQAATDRLMTITVPQGDSGVFGPLPEGCGSYRDFTAGLESAMTEQFGTAMPRFLRRLVSARHSDEAALQGELQADITFFKDRIGINNNNGSDVRVAEAFGLVYAAGNLARKYRVLPQAFDCLEAVEICYANFRGKVPIRQTLPERILAIAARTETMMIDMANLPRLTDAELEAAGAFIRTVKGERLILMTPSFGRRMFPDWNAIKGSAEFAELHRASYSDRFRGYRCRVRSNSKQDWFYALRLPQ